MLRGGDRRRRPQHAGEPPRRGDRTPGANHPRHGPAPHGRAEGPGEDAGPHRQHPAPVRAPRQAVRRGGSLADPDLADPGRLPQRQRGRGLPGRQAAADPHRDPAALADQRSPGRALRIPDELRGGDDRLRGRVLPAEHLGLEQGHQPQAGSRAAAAGRDRSAGHLRRGGALPRRGDGAGLTGDGAGGAAARLGAQADDAGDPGGREALGCLSSALAPDRRRGSQVALGDDHPDGDVRDQRFARAARALGRDAHQAHAARGGEGRDGLGQDDRARSSSSSSRR